MDGWDKYKRVWRAYWNLGVNDTSAEREAGELVVQSR